MLSQREWQFAKSENFMFTVPVQVSSLVSKLVGQSVRRSFIVHRACTGEFVSK